VEVRMHPGDLVQIVNTSGSGVVSKYNGTYGLIVNCPDPSSRYSWWVLVTDGSVKFLFETELVVVQNAPW